MVIIYPELIIIQPTTEEDLIDPVIEPSLLDELDIILASIDTDTFQEARQAGMFDFHYSPWGVE